MEKIMTGAIIDEREVIRSFREECGEAQPKRVELNFNSGGVEARRVPAATDIYKDEAAIARHREATRTEFENWSQENKGRHEHHGRVVEIADPAESAQEYAVVKMRNRKNHYDVFKSRNKVVRRTSKHHDFIDYKSINQLLGNEVVVERERDEFIREVK